MSEFGVHALAAQHQHRHRRLAHNNSKRIRIAAIAGLHEIGTELGRDPCRQRDHRRGEDVGNVRVRARQRLGHMLQRIHLNRRAHEVHYHHRVGPQHSHIFNIEQQPPVVVLAPGAGMHAWPAVDPRDQRAAPAQQVADTLKDRAAASIEATTLKAPVGAHFVVKS